MIDTSIKAKAIHRSKQQRLEGWIERIDLSNRRLYVRTGSRDKFGVCVLIPDQCDIRHLQHHLRLTTLLPCDQLSIAYHEDEFGAKVAQSIELNPV